MKALWLASLALGGCGLAVNPSGLRDLVDALAKDRASACVTAHATLYGTLTVCRSNATAAKITYTHEHGLQIEHVGAAGESTPAPEPPPKFEAAK